MSHQSHRSPLRAGFRAAGLLAIAVVVAACGQQTGAPTPPSSSSAVSSAPARPSVTVTVPGTSAPSSSPATPSPTPDGESSMSPSSPTSSPEPTSSTAPTTPTEPPEQTSSPEPTTGSTTTTTSSTTSTTTTTTPPTTTSRPPAGTGQLAGRVVMLDAGHNGGNGAHPEIINQQVPDGRGGTKPCNTTGTSTNDGYAEHAFNWSVTNYLKSYLEAEGIVVLMTREDADGVGPCIDVRAKKENESNAEVVVSIHADGYNEGERGFYIILVGPQTETTAPYADASEELAVAVRDELVAQGQQVSSWLGSNGITYRDDLTGMNMSSKPKILIEYGNMRDSQQASYMKSKEGQQAYARATAAGIIAYLQNN